MALSEKEKSYLKTLFDSHLGSIDRRLTKILANQREVAKTMATKEELNAALDSITTEVNKIGSDLAAELTRLNDLIAAGSDVSDSLAKAQAIAAQLQGIDATIPEQPTP